MESDLFLNKSFRALIGSIFLHGLLALTIVFSPSPKKDQGPVSIELVDIQTIQQNGTVADLAEEEQPPDEEELLEKLKEQASILTKYSKRVKEQSIVKAQEQADQFKISTAPRANNIDLRPRGAMGKSADTGRETKKLEKGKGEAVPMNEPTQGNFGKTVAIGGSVGTELIPGIKEGSFTALNADQFKYFSFFTRVKNAFGFRWVTEIRKFMRQSSPKELYRLSLFPSPTLLEILLDKEGMVVQINILKSSGSEELDNAAVQAFYQASPLNHPPKEMINPRDRMVRLYYNMLVHFRPVYAAGN